MRKCDNVFVTLEGGGGGGSQSQIVGHVKLSIATSGGPLLSSC